MKEQDIDRLFREAFHEAEEKPSQNVWQHIEKQLNEEQRIMPLYSKRKHWIAYAAAIIVFLGIGLTFLKLNFTSQKNQGLQITKHTEPIPTETVETVKDQADIKPEIIATTKAPQITKQNIKSPKENGRSNIELNIIRIESSKPVLGPIDLSAKITPRSIPVYQVTEVEDIKPLIEPEVEIESMYAQTATAASNHTLVTTILNGISEKIEISDSKDIRFRADEEGSISIDILNSLVKNRNKKRK